MSKLAIDSTTGSTPQPDCDMVDVCCDDLYPPPVDGDSEYRVERILDVWQPDENVNTFQYLVKWFGYPVSESTWEWEWNLYNCREALTIFHASRKK